jgi:hypothetical protein
MICMQQKQNVQRLFKDGVWHIVFLAQMIHLIPKMRKVHGRLEDESRQNVQKARRRPFTVFGDYDITKLSSRASVAEACGRRHEFPTLTHTVSHASVRLI